MEQFCYTSCPKGAGIEDSDGFQVRASTTGIRRERSRLDGLIRHVGYSLPRSMPAHSTDPAHAPIRFAFVATGPDEHMVVQSCYAGWHDNRPGNFFSHALVGLPLEFDALDAIRLWRSPFWQASGSGMSKELPPPRPEDLAPGPLCDGDIVSFVAEDDGRERLRFLLNAYLTLAEGQRLYIGAEPREVALFVYAIARVLPASFRKRLTFSTFETNVEIAPCNVVGTTWGTDGEADFPERLYNGMGIALNTFKGRSSELPASQPSSDYADFVVNLIRCLGPEFPAQLDPFLRICDEAGAVGFDELDRYRRVCLARHANPPDPGDFAAVLAKPQATRAFLRFPPFREIVFNEAVHWRGFASDEFPGLQDVPKRFQEIAQDCPELVEEVAAAAELAFESDDPVRAEVFLNQLLAVASPERADALRLAWFQAVSEEFRKGGDPRRRLKGLRIFLLLAWAKHRSLWPITEATKPAWHKWLWLSDACLAELLRNEDAPPAIQSHAAAVTLANREKSEPLGASIAALLVKTEIVAETYSLLMRVPQYEPLAIWLFCKAVERPGCPVAELLCEIHKRRVKANPDNLHHEFEALFERLPTRAIPKVVSAPPSDIEPLCSRSPALRRLAEASVGKLDASCIEDESARTFIAGLADNKSAKPEIQALVQNWMSIFRFLNDPKPFSEPNVLELGKAVSSLRQASPSPEWRTNVLVGRILRKVKGQSDLELVVDHLWRFLSSPSKSPAEAHPSIKLTLKTDAVSQKMRGALLFRKGLLHVPSGVANQVWRFVCDDLPQALLDAGDPVTATKPARKAIAAIAFGAARSPLLESVFYFGRPQLASVVEMIRASGQDFVAEMNSMAKKWPRQAQSNFKAVNKDLSVARNHGWFAKLTDLAWRFRLPILFGIALLAVAVAAAVGASFLMPESQEPPTEESAEP